MKRRNVIAGAAGAALVVVGVYEGRVALSREKTTVELSAGEEGQADRDGARRTGSASDRLATAEAPAEHALAKLDRVRADRQRELLRALFAEAGALPLPFQAGAPASPVASAPSAYPTMPLVPVGDAGATNIDPKYIQSVVRDDYFPLAKQCYAARSGRRVRGPPSPLAPPPLDARPGRSLLRPRGIRHATATRQRRRRPLSRPRGPAPARIPAPTPAGSEPPRPGSCCESTGCAAGASRPCGASSAPREADRAASGTAPAPRRHRCGRG